MVHTTCAVRDCMSSSRINKNLKFHQFPHTEERCKIWIEVCGRPDLVGKTSDSLRNTHICSLHFEERMYGKKSLKKTAIPGLLLPIKGTRSIHTQTDPKINILNEVDVWILLKNIYKNEKNTLKTSPLSKISRITLDISDERKKIARDSSQTNAELTNHTTRKRKPRKELLKTSKKLILSDEK